MDMLPWGMRPVLSSRCCQFTRTMGLYGPVHADLVHWADTPMPVPLFLLPRVEALLISFGWSLFPIMEIHREPKVGQEAAWWTRTKLRISWVTLRE